MQKRPQNASLFLHTGDNDKRYTATSMIPFANAYLYNIVPMSIIAEDGTDAAINVGALTLHTSKDGFWFTSNDADVNYIAKTLCPNYPWYITYHAVKK